MITERVIKALEYDKILAKLAQKVHSQPARELALSLRPAETFEEAKRQVALTFEADKIAFTHAIGLSFSFDSIADVLERAEKLSTLTIPDILRVSRALRISRIIRTNVELINDEELVLIPEIVATLYHNKGLEDAISSAVLSDTELRDDASPDLLKLRRAIAKCNANIKAKLNDFITSNRYQQYLRDFIVTIRSDRYVIPVKAECKSAIPGLVHDQSSTGSTIYVEPFQIVEMNNELKELQLKEKKEVERILAAFTYEISQICQPLSYMGDTIAFLDLVFAKTELGKDYNAIIPELNNKGYLKIVMGRHPLIDKDKVVPLQFELGGNYRILLITGPNTGGKTVTLKLVGLFTLLTMSGIPVPAKHGTVISYFESVFCDVGDEQSIEQSLSTFSSHIKNVTEVTNNVNSGSLVLLDEVGAGTDPVEGAALAVAITEHINASGARAVITTHYPELKAYSVSTDGVCNASMEFNPDTFEPTYKLSIGIPGASNALRIARRLGLNESIVSNAESRISGDKISFESVIMEAERMRIEYEQRLAEITSDRKAISEELDRVKAEKEEISALKNRISQNAKAESKKLVESYSESAEELLEELKKKVNEGTEQSLFEARRLNKKLSDLAVSEEKQEKVLEFAEGALAVGDQVFVTSLGSTGVITELGKREATVKIGNISSQFKLNAIKKLKSESRSVVSKKQGFASTSKLKNDAFSPEINVLGQKREECILNVEYYLDRATMAGVSEVKIIHGIGKGILKEAVWECLKDHKGVKSFRSGIYGEGDAGVTIVELK